MLASSCPSEAIRPNGGSTPNARRSMKNNQTRAGERHRRAPIGRFSTSCAGMILAAWVAALPVATTAAQTGNTVESLPADMAPSIGTAWQPSVTQISQFQIRLNDLGFDPGRPDGRIGPRTIAAIRGYQESIGAAADGVVTLELFQRLMNPDIAAAPSAATPFAMAGPSSPDVGAAPAGNDDCPVGAREYWRFQDSFGSSFELTLQTDGTVDGPNYPGHWQWQPKSQGIEIVYDNGMGLRVTRIGHLRGKDSMTGEAMDSRGQSWNWSAERLVMPPSDGYNCQIGSGAP